MTENHEDLPIDDDELDKRTEAVNRIAAELLPILLANLEKASGDEKLLKLYEADFLGDLYARMIVSVFMGFYPEVMGEDAQGAALRLIKMAGEEDNE
jgi:hypothetical protein